MEQSTQTKPPAQAKLPKARVIYYTSYTNSKTAAETIATTLKASGKVDADVEVDGIRAVTPEEVLAENPHMLAIGGPIQHDTRLAKPLLHWLKGFDKQAGKSNWAGSVLVFFTHAYKKMCDVAIGNVKQTIRELKHVQPCAFKKMLHLHVTDIKGQLEPSYTQDIEVCLKEWLVAVESRVAAQEMMQEAQKAAEGTKATGEDKKETRKGKEK
jgi:flavodoxin